MVRRGAGGNLASPLCWGSIRTAARALALFVLAGAIVFSAKWEPTEAQGQRAPRFSHIFVIVMENREADTIVGSREAPFINSLVNRYASAARYYAVARPSLPNYIAAEIPSASSGTV
jgi:hypothetical protein